MTAGNADDAIRAPGRLVVNPTGPWTGTYPYGGTEIGRAASVAWLSFGGGPRIECEGLGEASDVLEGRNRTVAAFELRGFDDDAIETLFAGNYTAGASGRARHGTPGSRTPGQSALGRAVVLLFVPDNPAAAPGWIAYQAVPFLQDAGEVMFMRSQRLQLPVAVECIRGSNGLTMEVGRLEDLPVPP